MGGTFPDRLLRGIFPRVLALLLVLMAVPGPALASHTEEGAAIPDYWSIQLENDFFAASGDRYYTNGFEILRLRPGRGPGWLCRLAGWNSADPCQGEETAVAYSLGQKIFTPEDKEATIAVPDDRPYAGYLFGSMALITGTRTTEVLKTGRKLEITLGLVGPASGADKTQEWFHGLVGNDVPKGWDNQLHNEPTLGFSYSRFWSVVQPGPGRLQFGFNPHLTLEAGNAYTYGAGGVMFRLGTNLWSDFNPPSIRPGFPGISYFEAGGESNWYLFFGHESRLVARDIFLDGNSYQDSHHVDKENLVGDYQFGFAYRNGHVRVTLSNMVRTKEFTTQNELTRYGALNLSFVY